MKKRIIIGTSCVVIFLVVFIVWIAGRKVKILQDIDVRTLSKIEIYYPGDNLTVVKEEEDMQKVIALFHSLRVRKTFADNDDGFVFSIQIYDKNDRSHDRHKYLDDRNIRQRKLAGIDRGRILRGNLTENEDCHGQDTGRDADHCSAQTVR